ncbi:MAG: IS1 family transposase [Clostridium sp.]|nr:IS1 family transposase [Clostridium sp.]
MIEIDNKLDNLNKYINEILKPSIFAERKRHIKACPKCGKKHFIKYGCYKGIQRYRCKDCGKTFSLATNSIWSYSKKDASDWIKFIEYMLEKKTLKYCAEKLDISINTAFYWRHKVLYAMTFNEIPKRLIGNIHMIKTSTKENFKGNKHIDTDVREKIFIVSAKGAEDSILCLPICKKRWDIKKFNEKIYSKIDSSSIIIPYLDRYIYAIAQKHNKENNTISKEEDSFISNFNLIRKLWFKPFYGVASKYLKEYFCWFIIFNLKKKFSNISFLKELIIGDVFKKIECVGA